MFGHQVSRNQIPRLFKRSLSSRSHLRNSEEVDAQILKNPFNEQSNSKKHQANFTEVFKKIMERQKMADNTKESSASKLQLVFESALEDADRARSLSPANGFYNKGLQVPNIHSTTTPLSIEYSDITDYKTKILENYRKKDEALIKHLQMKYEINEALAPTLQFIDSIDNDYDLVKYIEEQILTKFDTQNSNSNASAGQSFSKKLILEITKQSQETPKEPLVNSFTLSVLLNKAIQILWKKFNSPAEALSLFERTKNSSLKSFMYGCTVDVYNTIIELVWADYKNISTIKALLDEMQSNGIQENTDTITMVKQVTEEMKNIVSDQDDDILEMEEAYNNSESDELGKKQFTAIWSKEDGEDLLDLRKYVSRQINARIAK